MQPPVRRAALAEKAEADLAEDTVVSGGETVAERVLLSLELSELGYEAAVALGARWVEGVDDLADKANRLARPLRLLTSR